MRADTLDVTKLFVQNIQYVVPVFQRPYVWNEEEHWDPLWRDVQAVVRDGAGGGGEEHPHFLGAIVLDQQPTSVGAVDERQLIDGQQRLVTLQLLLAAVRDISKETGEERLQGRLSQLVANSEYVISDPEDALKVLPTRSDRTGFQAAIDDAGVSSIDSKLLDAYWFFRSAIRAWLESTDRNGTDLLGDLVNVLARGLRVVVIDLDDRDNAQVIFETLNARGTPLEAADLIKNDLLNRAKQSGHDVEELHDRHWARFLDDRWREEISQGRLLRSRIDAFMGYYLTMQTEREVRSSQLFSRFRSWLDGSGQDIRVVLASIDRYGEVFERIETLEGDSLDGTFMSRLNTLEVTTAYPLLLWLFGVPEDDLTLADRHTILRDLESFLIRRLLCKLTTRNYNRLFLTLLNGVKDNPSAAAATMRARLLAATGDAVRWPTDDEVRSAVAGGRMYGSLRQDRIELVLKELNRVALTDSLSEPIKVQGKLTIEHLMPQSWQQHWPLPDDPGAESRRELLINTLGNLTLATQKLNSSISNGPWADKRRAILQHSALSLNRQLPETWSDDAIEERGMVLANAIVATWPRPRPTVESSGNNTEVLDRVGEVEMSPDPSAERESALADEFIRRRGAGNTALRLVEDFTRRTRAFDNVEALPGRSSSSEDGFGPYLMLRHRNQRYGAFAYLTPSNGSVALRLPRSSADGRSHAEPGAAKDAYQVRIRLNTDAALEEAVELAWEAYGIVSSP